MTTRDLKATVRERYGRAALHVSTGAKTACCGGSCGGSTDDPITLEPLHDGRDRDACPPRPCSPRSAAATRPRSPS